MTYQDEQREIVRQLQEMFDRGESPASIVDSVSDFETDPRVCLTIITFPPDHIKKRIAEIQNELRKIDPNQHYYPEDSLHLTIRNVRVISDPKTFSEEDIDKVKNVVARTVSRHNPIKLTFDGFLRTPMSLSAVAYSDEDFQHLIKDPDRALADAGVADDKRYISDDVFFGNITVVRYKSAPSEEFFKRIAELESLQVGSFDVTDVHVIATNAVLAKAYTKDHGVYSLGVDQSEENS